MTSFSDVGYVDTEITDERGRAVAAINGLQLSLGTDIQGGLEKSRDILRKARLRDRPPGEAEPIEVVVILSDGHPAPANRDGRGVARSLKGDGVVLMSICVGGDCDRGLMRSLASETRLFFDVRDPPDGTGLNPGRHPGRPGRLGDRRPAIRPPGCGC